ncbi:hypothetical protein L0E83_03190 [Marichromatium gracile]|uniref:hypothetical protein n=1 Tax=Marichromatium gracile TaxID=1048 RepID=UPI001F1CA177|nr:hypothetical protein [Marichromatium gracile]MCF1182441.1 hypothetical protein [Marichromatium gracile]
MNTDINHEHLTLVQGVINRLAGNSFALKGWSVTLVSALLALAVSEAKLDLVVVALLPAVVFWGLDGYFLAQERLFRNLYERLIAEECKVPDFSMKTAPLTAARWFLAVRSVTLWSFHGAVILVVLCVLIWSPTNAS